MKNAKIFPSFFELQWIWDPSTHSQMPKRFSKILIQNFVLPMCHHYVGCKLVMFSFFWHFQKQTDFCWILLRCSPNMYIFGSHVLRLVCIYLLNLKRCGCCYSSKSGRGRFLLVQCIMICPWQHLMEKPSTAANFSANTTPALPKELEQQRRG